MQKLGPIERSYWADRERLLVGPYPGEYDEALTRSNLRGLLQAGARTFISLMEAREEGAPPGSPAAYVRVLEQTAERLAVPWDFKRFEIHDMSIPELEQMDVIQAALDAAFERDHPVYLHCWGGRGRAGTVVGCYLIRRGLATPADFVQVIDALRPPGTGSSPETADQVAFVRRYADRLE